MGWAILCCIVFISCYSVKRLLTTTWEGQVFSFKNFLLLTVTYSVLLIGFATIFTVITMEGIVVLVMLDPVNTFWSLFSTCLYFSAMMLFSVGNGEIIPVGIGRFVSMFATYLGHTLPVTVVWTMVYNRTSTKR